eukprot:3794236-Amphidinium_carterae.1
MEACLWRRAVDDPEIRLPKYLPDAPQSPKCFAVLLRFLPQCCTHLVSLPLLTFQQMCAQLYGIISGKSCG